MKGKHKTLTIINNAYVSDRFLGGGDRYSFEIALRLKKFTITVITPQTGYSHWKKTPLKAVNLQILRSSIFDNRTHPLALALAYLLRSFQTYFRLISIPAPEILFCSSDLLPDTLPAFLYKLTHDVSWVVHIGHLVVTPLRRPGNPLVNTLAWITQRICLLFLRRANLILADNHELAHALVNSGIPKKFIQVHYGGAIDFKTINSYKPKLKKHFTAVWVGRLSPLKGTHDLVAIWKEVIAHIPHARLAIVGSGQENFLGSLKHEIRAAGLHENISLLGFREHHQGKSMPLFDVLKNAKVFLFTDYEAGFGLAVCEAMAAGLPIVAYNLPIFGTTYSHGFVTAPLSDTKTFSRRIINLLENPRIYAKMRRDSMRQAKEFDWEKIISRLQKSLNELGR